MTLLLRFTRGLASAVHGFVRLSPKVIPLALVSMVGLSSGRTADVDRDRDGEEATRSIVYRHYI
ncbi:hypothetical protein MKK50_23905 [Methylobacterium sp. J-043]|uniref:hypothetical protein n=1 Tax=Methylorubrum TaxID=2282523 RepID=UPI00209D8B1F|nr:MULTISPECIES: hypothetical protein [Methylorubrum]MCJ2032415.1 hypothetical protein [Methylobacterium sp. J-043]MCP1549954.1 hypothetical protein [Methylorubrum zatmanii]MCP1553432.1 hypothetical protein [Methylorubrum extorquens]MCP1580256.1 hypothetical protein [Methylorubrum extorquens]